MGNVTQATTYTKIKQSTDSDSRNFGPLVSAYENQTSTINQTSISLTLLTCDLARKSSVMVFIDGQLLTEGAANDYVWVGGLNNNSSQITLATAIPAGLNIQVYKIGASQTTIANADTIQSSINLVLNEVNQKNNNRLINGNFDQWNRQITFAAIATATYAADRWVYTKSGAMVHTIARSTSLPTTSKSTYSMQLDCTTLDAAIASTEFTAISQRIEGNFLRTFKGKSMVLAFDVNSTKIGTFCVAIKNGGNTRAIIKEYTVNATNTWERKYIRFQHDVTGTWSYDTSIGMTISWVLAAGSTFQTTANTWQTGDYLATTNQVNACDSASNDFFLADVTLVEDNSVQTKLPDYCLAGDDIVSEESLCKRYYERGGQSFPGGTAVHQFVFTNLATYTSGCNYPDVFFKIPKRVAPTVNVYDAAGNVANVTSYAAGGGASTNSRSVTPAVYIEGFRLGLNTAIGTHAGAAYSWFADSEL